MTDVFKEVDRKMDLMEDNVLLESVAEVAVDHVALLEPVNYSCNF